MNIRRTAASAGALGLTALILAACSTESTAGLDMSVPMRDGEWVGYSDADDQGSVGTLTITVEGGDITSAVFETTEADGTVKGTDYGKNSSGEIFNQDYYDKAQIAVESFAQYAQLLVDTDDPNKVDVISGATTAHSQFIQAAIRAVAQAQGTDDSAADSISIPGLEDATSLDDTSLDSDLGNSDLGKGLE